MKKAFSNMLNLQTHYHLNYKKIQKLDSHTGGELLIDGTKHHKDNKLRGMELPCRII